MSELLHIMLTPSEHSVFCRKCQITPYSYFLRRYAVALEGYCHKSPERLEVHEVFRLLTESE